MGVRGLTTYINRNEFIFLKPILLHDTCLIIDGNNLCAQLYRSLKCFSAFGGDYDKCAAYTKRFFHSLSRCNVTCYVVFDGSYEKRKLKTAYYRLKSKIYGASKLDPVTQSSLQIFPLLLLDVFKDVLVELKIPYTVCEFEADDEIAAMARHLNCPVLSYDSDFFIYNVLYIPFNTLEMKPISIKENDKKKFAMECKIYKVKYFVDHFGGLKEEMLPLLATVLGNDYVEKRLFKNFFSQLKLIKNRTKKNEQQRSIDSMLKWLRDETLESAIEKILGRMKKNKKHIVYYKIKNSIDGYSRKHCRSLKYFNLDDGEEHTETLLNIPDKNIVCDCDTELNDAVIDEEISNDEESSNNDDNDSVASNETVEIITDEQENADDFKDAVSQLPEWFTEGVRNGFIPQSYMNLYTHHLYFCSPQAEDYSQKDSFLCTLPILRYAFDILYNYSEESCTYITRDNYEYRRLSIGRDYSISQPYESSINLMIDIDKLPSCFEHFIKEKLCNLDCNTIECLPTNYQLTMLSTLWWVANCNVSLTQVYSVFLCYIMLEVIDEKTGMFRGHHFFINKHSKKLEELRKRIKKDENSGLFLNKNKVLYEDCLLAASELLLYFEIDSEIRKRPKSYDHKRVHAFAQLQCCLRQFNSLNVLCRRPYDSTVYSKCINGLFLYNVSKKLDKHIDPMAYIEKTMLKGAASVLQYFKSLCMVYEQCATQLGIFTTKVVGKKRNRRRKSKNISFLCEEFESEVII